MKNKTKNFYKFLSLFLLLVAFIAAPDKTFGEESIFSITPKIVDLKGKQKDVFQETIILENRAERKLNIYAFVQNISSEKGKEEFQEPSDADHATSLANWIAVTRGALELKPNETREIEMSIEVNLRAKPGVYHARVAFGEGGTRSEAEKKIAEDTAAIINLEVEEDIKEWLNLKKFVPKRSVFFTSPITFAYTLENSGNTPIHPRGKVFIYNKRGEEMGMLESGEETTIEPGGAKELTYAWEKTQGLGQLKAIVEIAYGEKNPRRIQDTVFFWVIPWQTLALIFGGGIAMAILLSLLKHFIRGAPPRAPKRENKNQKIMTDIWHPK